jgi:hypothetical protein
MALPAAGGLLGSVGLVSPVNRSHAAAATRQAQASQILAIRIFGLVEET